MTSTQRGSSTAALSLRPVADAALLCRRQGTILRDHVTLHGHLQGLAPSETKLLERLYRRKVPTQSLFPTELARPLCDISHQIRRQVGLLVDRSGTVTHVIVGDSTKLFIPDLGRVRAGASRFRGLRLLHTHLHQEPISRDDLVDLTRLRLDLVAALLVATDGLPFRVYYAHNVPNREGLPYVTVGPIPFSHLDLDVGLLIRELETDFAREAKRYPRRTPEGRAILVHVSNKRDAHETEASLIELKELARTAGLEVVDTITQVRPQVDPRYVVGRGKLDDITLRAMQLDADVLVIDREVSAAQSTALAEVSELKIIDRTQLILDIFAMRAESRVGKVQVELAQMKYLLPRLGTRDDALSRLTGGIGGRGPGETKLEIGRRRARERVHRLEAELKTLAKTRRQMRGRRRRREVPHIAIVGYTNAGKSTLLNTLTQADVLAEDKLFATLDPRSKRLRLPREREVVISDTVGFIRHLPKDLFGAFRSTFEAAQEATLLLEVIDASDPELETYVTTTAKLLTELELDHVEKLTVYNKADKLSEAQREGLRTRGLVVSAPDPATLRPLLEAMEACLDIALTASDASANSTAIAEEDAIDREPPDYGTRDNAAADGLG